MRTWLKLIPLLFLLSLVAQATTYYISAAGASQDEFSWQGNRLRNNVTGSNPCVLHFNGHTPGIDKTFERRFSACVVLKAT